MIAVADRHIFFLLILPLYIYSVKLGATTMWEHWDGINEKGDMWSARMNSFNHYAYGAVADWLYEVAAGIGQSGASAGFEEPVITPHPDKRLQWFEAKLMTQSGEISSKWIYTQTGDIRYEITVPTRSQIVIDGKFKTVEKGSYIFYTKAN